MVVQRDVSLLILCSYAAILFTELIPSTSPAERDYCRGPSVTPGMFSEAMVLALGSSSAGRVVDGVPVADALLPALLPSELPTAGSRLPLRASYSLPGAYNHVLC